ncbi:MAG TPA: DNRLRE domain-containing protein, partial [Streptosporangiaceae bacterium]|nr:DNRLRE domain-containing protein [Streptosporangiaceae bacterium]
TSLAIRFAIFQSEGGPVPNGATITSATLSLYKIWGPVTGESTFKASRFLKNWNEMEATWSQAASGVSWQTPGAFGSQDVAASPDGQGTVSTDIDIWLNIDVTSGVQAFAAGTPNFGWKVAYVSGGDVSKPKSFYSKEASTSGREVLRPKLTISYTTGTPPPPGSTSATLMDGLNSYTGTADDRLGNGGTNEGSATTYALIGETSTSLAIRFAIFQSEGGPVPNGATINSAMLSMYKFSGPASNFKASRFLKDWTEMGATWFVTGTGASWTTAGAMSAGSDYLATPDGQASIGDGALCGTGTPGPDSCWLNLDVTAGVRAFASGTPNFGWKVADTTGTGGTPRNFNSSENTQWPTLRPKLTINYSTPTACTPPTAQFTTTTSGFTATFNASGSTDGSSAITSLRLQFGDGLEVIWGSKTQPQQHTYSAVGTYNATLTATNACGTSAPVTQPVTITISSCSAPTASFTWSQRPGSLTVDFNASNSTDNGSPITSLNIAFGDGQQAVWSDKNLPQPHAYAGPGPEHVTLTATNVCGTSAPFAQDIQVSDPNVIPSSLPTEGRA